MRWTILDELKARRKAWKHAKEDGMGIIRRIIFVTYAPYPAVEVLNKTYQMEQQNFAGVT